MPMGFPPEGIESVRRFVPRHNDIFVVSYPKSGTTWLQYIVYLLVRGRALGADESLNDEFGHLEDVGAAAFDSMPHPRLIKTHLNRSMTPYADACRYLVIARNPFDCAVSFFHHTRGFPQHYDFADGSFDAFFECFLAGEVDFGDYFDHLTGWRAETDRDNVLFLTYEGLTRDPAKEIRRVADFLGTETASSVATVPALDRVIDETSLASMRRNQQRWSSLRPNWAPAFVRRGGIGDWRSLFTPGQAGALLEKSNQSLGGAGIGDLWPDVLAEARAFAGPDSPNPERMP